MRVRVPPGVPNKRRTKITDAEKQLIIDVVKISRQNPDNDSELAAHITRLGYIETNYRPFKEYFQRVHYSDEHRLFALQMKVELPYT